MNHILALQQERNSAVEGAKAIADKAKGRAWTAEEQKAFDDFEATANNLTGTLDREQRMASLSNIHTDKHHVTEAHNNAEDKPFGPEAGSSETKAERRYRMSCATGEFLQCVKHAAHTPSGIDPRLQKRAALGANEKVGSEGGFLVGKDVSSQILEDMHEVGILAPKCTEVPVGASSNGTIINGVDETSRVDGSRFGGVQAYWADEAGTITATKPKFRQIRLELKKLFSLFYATDETVQDAAQLGALANKAFAEEMAFRVDDAIFRGLGGGQPLGILKSGVLVSVPKEAGQAAATILYENIVKMFARMPARSQSRGVFFINIDTMPQIMLMTLPGGTSSTPVFLPPGGATVAPYGTLMGRPIIPIEHCSTVGTQGDIVLADFSQYLLATKGGLQQAESMHVQFLTGEMTYRFTYRVDGQTARSAPLTPFKGAATQGPFIVLDTR